MLYQIYLLYLLYTTTITNTNTTVAGGSCVVTNNTHIGFAREMDLQLPDQLMTVDK